MIRFFDPDARFLDWLAEHARGRIVFDVGCGEGHVVLSLRERGVKVIGIDPRFQWVETRDIVLASCILPMFAQECKALKTTQGSLVLFCRPCHNGFVTETIDLLPESAEVLYVGKRGNVVLDIPEFAVEEVAAPPCPEEKVYRVLRERERMVA